MRQNDPTELEQLREQLAALEAAAADKDARLAGLEARLDALLATTPVQLAPAPAAVADPDPSNGVGGRSGGTPAEVTADADGVLARRSLLKQGGMAMAAAVAGAGAATLTGAGPAAAANGDPIQAGVGNSQTNPTSLIHSGASLISLFLVSENFGAAGPTMNAAVAGFANTSAKAGVLGFSQNAAGAGVYGYGKNGAAGVTAESTGSDGVQGVTASGGFAGVRGSTTAASAVGVLGTNTVAGSTAVAAVASQGKAFIANASNGDAVTAIASAPSGVAATVLHSTGGTALQVNTTGVHALLSPAGTPVPSRSGAVAAGSLTCDGNGDLWLCTVAGNPGTWRKLAGPATAGAFHPLATPVRVYDSRLPGAGGTFGDKVTRTLDATKKTDNTASGVPAGATALLVNLAATNTNPGGFAALWATGPYPGNASVNWALANFTTSNGTTTALTAAGKFQCRVEGSADIIVDVIGYYR